MAVGLDYPQKREHDGVSGQKNSNLVHEKRHSLALQQEAGEQVDRKQKHREVKQEDGIGQLRKDLRSELAALAIEVSEDAKTLVEPPGFFAGFDQRDVEVGNMFAG